MPRTVRDFPGLPDTWPRIDAWAAQQGFQMTQQLPAGRQYQKGTGLLVAPIVIEVSNSATGVHFEGWVKANTFLRLGWLFMIGDEVPLDGGLALFLPRKMGRNAANELLKLLGGQPIT